MKKILTLTLVVMLMLTLASCSWMGKIKDIFVPNNNTSDNTDVTPGGDTTDITVHTCTGKSVVVTEPTCSTPGENAVVCTICNKTMETVEVAKPKVTVTPEKAENKIDVKEYKQVDLREKISIALQKSELFAGTIAENIAWGKPDASLDEISEAINRHSA